MPTGFLAISGKERHPGGDWEEEDSKLQVALFTFLLHPGPQLCVPWLFSRPLLLVPSGLGTSAPASSALQPCVGGEEQLAAVAHLSVISPAHWLFMAFST